ncbi:MAG: helix-turn-helix domain-containing protein [Oscillospiraceae bacterium]|nr:helix-turn-helix domain-containing protein [Oscillospiraceae bacterium]
MHPSVLWKFADEGYIRCSVERVGRQDQQRLAAVRVYFILSGQVTLRTISRIDTLAPDSLAIVNKGEFFSVPEGDALSAVFDLDITPMERKHPDLWFDFNPSSAEDASAVVVLKEFLARFIKFNLDLDQDNTYLNRSLYYAIMHHLITFFLISKPAQDAREPELLTRIEQIAEYIDKHYHEPLHLTELAERFYLSVPYMSKMFKRYFGMNFTEYLQSIRLQSSLFELQRDEHTIEEIAGLFGFPNSRSYIAGFRKRYGVTPGEYRRRRTAERANPAPAVDLAGLPRSHQLEILARYLQNDEITVTSGAALPSTLTELPPCDVRTEAAPFPHTWQKIASIGSAAELLSAENQTMLRELQREIGFRYILFHGLLDDDMMVYGETAAGEPELNFGYIDMAFDFLLSIGLTPFVELSYMPRLLARPDARYANAGRGCISLPKDMGKWELLMERLVKHLDLCYGPQTVASWPFTLWNLPDSGSTIFGLGSPKEYFDFYLHTYRAIRRCNSGIRFCGPSCLTETAERGDYLMEFLKLCREHNCVPELLRYHFYPMRFRQPESANVRTEPHLAYRASPNALRESIELVKTHIQGCFDRMPPMIVSEWNASISHRELLSDTAFQAAYIAKNTLENAEGAEALCYWTLSDSIREVNITDSLYHGGLGLFTFNGIKKASYQAFRILARLGDRKIASGDGWCVTESEKGIQILLYNYQHYSQLYADGELFDMTFLNRYTPFVNPTRRKFSLPLTGLTSGRYILTETVINTVSGSSFDKWVELGALPLTGNDDRIYLQAMSLPQVRKRIIRPDNDSLELAPTLEPHEVRLIELQHLDD